ncbi:hypothetical protein [Paracoccus saliphilus]|uniref:Uncharacterized protein n=1 Tax=Paracoccus saliphilus TaxID=405559 RepID=A0AA45W5P0_9RHOB|nr:hypothetical protein [Paracoccus saliphilus]WCR02391.1 hypothetical protein JHX88_16150 [Paracoccus saliphilus]SIS94673.1 hypothetical protein SAMN05421772_109180 [Paracoccus saliphilus]
MKRLSLALALAAFAASPALAFQCPADMSQIDAALETASLSEEELARVKELRALGETEHETGDHQAAVDALAEAKEILGL